MEYNNTEATTTSTQNNTACITQDTSFAMKKLGELTNVLEAVATITDEATIEFDSESMHVRAMDPSHVSLIDVVLPNSCFETWGYGVKKIGVRVEDLVKALKKFDKNDYAKFVVEDNLVVRQEEQKVSLRLIESASGNTPLPKLNFNAKFWLNKVGVKKMLKFLDFSEMTTIAVNANTVTLASKDDMAEYEHKYDMSNGLAELLIKDESKATYSSEYLKKFLRIVAQVHDEIIFEYSSKMPMRVEVRPFKVGTMHFYLAPRVQD